MNFNQLIAGQLCYLSGPISGLDKEVAIERFKRAEEICKRNGAAAVFNPLNIHRQRNRKEWTYHQHMLADLHTLTTNHKSDGLPSYVLVRLPGWSTSEGAKVEDAVAAVCGIERYDIPVTEW